ncbi:MAG TPA: endonuclease/exonuclease/phosphatase family protein [Candidatus Binataceae bacterium]|nr:endonuclease/exonuclease/phosphatase family protein [Candidatus Binataceae bacterium]
MSRTEYTILTLNVFHDLPMYRHLQRRCALIAEAIAARRPHVAALQEVLHSTGTGDLGAIIRDSVNRLCGGELYRLDYAMADGAGDDEFSFDEGVALLSRLETDGPAQTLKYCAQVELAAEVAGHRYRLPDNRVAMRRRFRLPNGARLDVCVSHLTDRPEYIDAVAVRTMQARELAAWASAGSDPETTVILAGDFNDVAGSEAIASLKRAGFIDLHEAFGSGPGYTNDRDDIDLNAGHATHNQRIDYLMMRPADGRAPAVMEVGLFAERPYRESDGTWLWLSDHIGVIATLRL